MVTASSRSKPRGRFPFTTRAFVLVSRNGGESLTHPPNTQIDDRPLRILTLAIMSHRTAPSDAQAHLGCPVFDEHCDCGVYFVHGTTLTAHRGALTWGLPSECHIGRNVAGIKSLHTWDYTAGPAKPSHNGAITEQRPSSHLVHTWLASCQDFSPY